MKQTIKEPSIQLKATINQEDYELIQLLETKCCREDQITLKLELDYKRSATITVKDKDSDFEINEFMYFDGKELIGYIGICSFGGSDPEITGMVHPNYRRLGIFSKLFVLVLSECKRRKANSILLLCDQSAASGQKFMKHLKALYQYSEYEMYLEDASYEQSKKQSHHILLRKATNQDAPEIARQNAIYFGDELDEENEGNLMPEEEERRGMTIYLAEMDDKIIGKIHLQLIDGVTGGIYGLGVLPENRGKGYGRAILLHGIEVLKGAKASKVMLQVEAKNATALHLYKSCGFKETSVMDYFKL